MITGKDYDEPQATYPTMRPEDAGLDTLKICPACNNGVGDGICGYHHQKGQKMIRRAERIYGHIEVTV